MGLADVTLYNAGETVRTDDGVRPFRVPESVRQGLNERSQAEYRRPDGVEIRFVGDGPVEVTLSAEGECEVTPFWGPFETQPDEHVTVGEEPTTIEVSLPERVAAVDRDRLDQRYVDPTVGRLVLFGDPITIHDVSGDVRPPEPVELPDRRLLTYGTSITQGAFASRYPMSYAHATARRLGMDHVNLGSGGSAFCDEAIADHIAARKEWDVAIISVSVNMLAVGFSATEFRERATYLLEAVADADPTRPVVAITLFPVFTELCPSVEPGEDWESTAVAYREALRDAVTVIDRDNVTLLEGPELLADPGGLSTDLLHPMDHGMGQIAERLATRLEPIG